MDVIQQCEVTGIRRDGGRVVGVDTTKGAIDFNQLLSAGDVQIDASAESLTEVAEHDDETRRTIDAEASEAVDPSDAPGVESRQDEEDDDALDMTPQGQQDELNREDEPPPPKEKKGPTARERQTAELIDSIEKLKTHKSVTYKKTLAALELSADANLEEVPLATLVKLHKALAEG
jgi:leucyl aminopeptidase (aminopeptidase T)